MPPVGFETTIPVSERPQTDALDRAATGIGKLSSHKLSKVTVVQRYLFRRLGGTVTVKIEAVNDSETFGTKKKSTRHDVNIQETIF
jgi:hypothetical protein